MTAPASERILAYLSEHPTTAGEAWNAFDRGDWPHLFALLAVAADLPRLSDNRALEAMPRELWPQLSDVAAGVCTLQQMIDNPQIPRQCRMASCRSLSQLDTAVEELERAHCVTIDFLLEPQQRPVLDSLIEQLAIERMGKWGQLERTEAPDVFDVFDAGLASDRFLQLTGFELERDEYSLTLSLQDLDPAGIGWHRDLYWPREWVGQDVFAVLYGLGGDSPEKGGAFLYYAPSDNAIYACYRQKHQATVLWNSKEDTGRILHAVSRYLTADTSRHLIILQCLRNG